VNELADPLGQLGGYVGEQISGADYTLALKVRELLQLKMAQFFESFDVLVAAAEATAASPIEMNLESGPDYPDPLGAVGNLCGLPALSVPCGFTEKHLPVGLQFVARAGDDLSVIQAAREFQRHTDWHLKHPKLPI
jgi:aspartyl-tRNA(Asn)/glutamyl-tRNA(Gln) amidotransferase subunit A